jgi:hypothetical protein
LNRSGNKTADEYERIGDIALERALIVARTGRTRHMAEKVTLARYELFLKDMISEIGNGISNYAILQNEYGTRCKEVMEHPGRMMKEWTDEAMNK